MCFSLLASVAAGAALSVAGVLTVSLARRRRELPLALIPLLFGVQQLSEGVVWWSVDHGNTTQNVLATLAYSLFSRVLWPIFVPFAVLFMKEPLKLDYLWAALCLAGAVFFMFRS